MAAVNTYATVQQLRDELGDDGAKLDNGLLEKAINAASRAIDRFTGRRFWSDAQATSRVYRPRVPEAALTDDIATAAGLAVATDTDGDGVYETTWTADEFLLEPRNLDVVASGDTVTPFAWWRLLAVDDRSFPVHSLRPTLQVTARFGWSAIPDEVTEAAVLKAVGLFSRKNAPYGIASFSEFGPVRVSRSDPHVMELLQPFIRITRPD